MTHVYEFILSHVCIHFVWSLFPLNFEDVWGNFLMVCFLKGALLHYEHTDKYNTWYTTETNLTYNNVIVKRHIEVQRVCLLPPMYAATFFYHHYCYSPPVWWTYIWLRLFFQAALTLCMNKAFFYCTTTKQIVTVCQFGESTMLVIYPKIETNLICLLMTWWLLCVSTPCMSWLIHLNL